MSTEIRIPRAGERGFRARIERWLVSEGDTVRKGMPILRVAGEGVTVDVEAPEDGHLQRIRVPAGQQVMTGISVGTISRYAPEAVGSAAESLSLGLKDARRAAEDDSAAAYGLPDEPDYYDDEYPGPEEGALRPPSAAAAAGDERLAAAPPGEAAAGPEAEDVLPEPPGEQHKPFRLNERLLQPRADAHEAAGSAQHNWVSAEVDLTGVQACLDSQALGQGGTDAQVNHTAFYLNAVAHALISHPRLNASWQDGAIRYNDRAHVKLVLFKYDARAVAVVQDAERRSISSLAAVKAEFSDAEPERLDSTFTLNVRSSMGCVAGGERIEYPQVAALNVDSVSKKPVIISKGGSDSIAIRPIMNICLSFDARVVDSLNAIAFIQEVRSRIESFSAETVLE